MEGCTTASISLHHWRVVHSQEPVAFLSKFPMFQALRKAEVDLSAALDLNPDRAELWNDRAACRAQAGKHEEACADTHQALRLWPKFAQALSNQGNAYRAMGHLDAALGAYNAALLADPLDARTWNNRGALQEERGNLVAAELDLRRALELQPDNARARANQQRIASKLLESALELMSEIEEVLGIDAPVSESSGVGGEGSSPHHLPKFHLFSLEHASLQPAARPAHLPCLRQITKFAVIQRNNES